MTLESNFHATTDDTNGSRDRASRPHDALQPEWYFQALGIRESVSHQCRLECNDGLIVHEGFLDFGVDVHGCILRSNGTQVGQGRDRAPCDDPAEAGSAGERHDYSSPWWSLFNVEVQHQVTVQREASE